MEHTSSWERQMIINQQVTPCVRLSLYLGVRAGLPEKVMAEHGLEGRGGRVPHRRGEEPPSRATEVGHAVALVGGGSGRRGGPWMGWWGRAPWTSEGHQLLL